MTTINEIQRHYEATFSAMTRPYSNAGPIFSFRSLDEAKAWQDAATWPVPDWRWDHDGPMWLSPS